MTLTQHMQDISVAVLIFFVISCLVSSKRALVQKLYIITISFLIVWNVAVIAMDYSTNQTILWILDATTCVAMSFMIMTLLIISIVFTQGYVELPKKFHNLYFIPSITSLIVLTNPLHHLYYRHFSIYASEVKFGPLFVVTGLNYYVCSFIITFIFLRFGIRTGGKSIWAQVILFIGGLMFPLVVNIIATLKIADLSIAATPTAFIATAVLHGIAVYFLNFLNIKPAALENLMNTVPEGYAVISLDGCLVYCNPAFEKVIGNAYNLKQNSYLEKDAERLVGRKKDVVYTLINFFEVCKKSQKTISYEQTLLDDDKKIYYGIELSPVFSHTRLTGVMALFRDVTDVKREMQKKQQDISRAMEQERLVALGQMIGSISHNLKTPIMAISGDVNALERLVQEYDLSVGDEEITVEDHHEIAGEMRGWLGSIREGCTYMSDIITTVKGMATNLSTPIEEDYTIDEVFSRVSMFLKSKLIQNKSTLVVQNDVASNLLIHGDINSMVQVLNNLVDNACDAMPEEGGTILLAASKNKNRIRIMVKDEGYGIPDDVMKRLFRSMFTTKGTRGTGIGLYSSAEIIKARFGGRIWANNHPDGGAAFYIEFPVNKEEVVWTDEEE